MSGLRAFSSPELLAPEKNQAERSEDHSFEGISTNVKLLLKLIQDHNEACIKEAVDERKAQRVAGMMSIIEDVKARIQKSQTSSRKPELRRCNTDLRANAPKDKKPNEPMIIDEKEKLRRQLSASLAARKSLEMMCTSLGKEKEIMAAELSRKVQEVGGLEELVSDLRAQNDMLLAKVKTCAVEHKEKKETGHGNSALQDRNKALSEQLLKSLDGYRSLKRKLKDSHDEGVKMTSTMVEIESEVQKGFARISSLKEKISSASDAKEEISALESMFECLALKFTKHKQQKKNECPKNKSDSKASKVSVIA